MNQPRLTEPVRNGFSAPAVPTAEEPAGDDLIKSFQDTLCEKYGFDDRDIYGWEVEKKIVREGEEHVAFEIRVTEVSPGHGKVERKGRLPLTHTPGYGHESYRLPATLH
jgi:hypothetical protein